MTPDEQWQRDYAEEVVVLLTEVGAEHPDAIGIIGDSGMVEILLNRDAALAVAARINALCVELPKPAPLPELWPLDTPRQVHRSRPLLFGDERPVRRRRGVDDHLRALDD